LQHHAAHQFDYISYCNVIAEETPAMFLEHRLKSVFTQYYDASKVIQSYPNRRILLENIRKREMEEVDREEKQSDKESDPKPEKVPKNKTESSSAPSKTRVPTKSTKTDPKKTTSSNREVSKKPKEVKAQAASAAQTSKVLTGKDEIARLKKIIETMKASTTSSSSSSSSSSDLARSSGTSSGIDLSLSFSSVPVNSVSSSHSAPYPYPSLYTVSPPPSFQGYANQYRQRIQQ
jgi:hypothetical protein